MKFPVKNRWRIPKYSKYFIAITIFWLLLYIYLSNYQSELLMELRKKDVNMKNIQEKLSRLVVGNAENEPRRQIEEILEEPEMMAAVENVEKVEMDDGITDEARELIKQFGLVNAGENGDPVILPANLSLEIQLQINASYDLQGYNAFVSNMVSLNRNLPDVRSDECKKKIYTNLPKCSIMIPFHNEDWMLLMRTVHSVMNRSPPELIEEIVLADDASDRDYLKKPLDEYIKKYPKIKIVRSPRRQGIIPNRMLGHYNCKGPIIVSIDSHVEVFPGWLEPILDRFTKDPNVLVWPKVSSVDKDNLHVWADNNDAGAMGGFKWSMDFTWLDVKWFEGDHPTPMWEPKRSPTFLGAVHAISKEFFEHLGMFDDEFDVWGGEDVELSFKVWLCGGKIEYVPCSFTAHMYKQHKYTWPLKGKGGYRWNTDRIAEVWLDDYIRYYYRTVGDTKDRNFGDVSERLKIKKSIGCKPFKWFIDNVYPKSRFLIKSKTLLKMHRQACHQFNRLIELAQLQLPPQEMFIDFVKRCRFNFVSNIKKRIFFG